MKTEPSARRPYSGFYGVIHKVLDKARRIIRFMGLRTVKPYPPNTPLLMSRESSSPYQGKELTDRKVSPLPSSDKEGWLDTLCDKYVGFRANNKNLKSLLSDLTQAKAGQWPDESDEQFQYRLKSAMALSGLGSLLQGQALVQQRRIAPSIKSGQIQKLGTYLTMKPAEFYRNKEFGTLLVNNLRNQPVKNAHEARNCYLFCRAYLEGIAQEALASTGYDMSDKKLSDVIPDLPIEKMTPDYIESLNKSINSMDIVTPTAAETVQQYCNEQGIAFTPGTKKVLFDSSDKLHQSLFLLQYLRSCYGANQQAVMRTIANVRDADKLQELLPEKTHASNLSDHMREITETVAHNLMKKSMPDSFAVPSPDNPGQANPFSYQHVLLVGENGQCYWNSDDNQPRHGRQDEKPLESFERYLVRSEKEQA
ncbi:hypothetical protein [Endozoicomonas euniceicola]|uniref:Uncharacterized protein n=1 Tax=Endozoicomonas euniceicola TaxID=1234143 RepID=A0ABY6GVI7_9GAMM|nr:hypothetical protein [Endozoicomonas euniceicola]UYM16775.1 hypothetical protein NX720_02290 [Endozoicomonas euniceicola]